MREVPGSGAFIVCLRVFDRWRKYLNTVQFLYQRSKK
jgi:hypothetical protein